jgi:hypothetical protein
MDSSQLFKERVEVVNDAVRMKKPKRVPFITIDAFWRYYDQGYKLSEALLNYQSIEDALVGYAKRYQVDGFLDIGDRNPLQATRSLGNFEYRIADENNMLEVKEQCCFSEEDYDLFAKNPVKTLWENVIPKKYSFFKPDMPAEVLQNSLLKFLEYAGTVEKTKARLADECGVPPLTSQRMGVSIMGAFEVLYSFLRGMKALSMDLRRRPEKIQAFVDAYDALYVKPLIRAIERIDEPRSLFTALSPLLSQNLVGAKDWGKYSWPHFKEFANRIVETDGTLFVLSEGTTAHLTEYLQELPKGHFCFYVESDDIFQVRKRLPNLCLLGGLPLSLLANGTKQECIDYTKKLIDEVGRDGGLILSMNKFPSSPGDCRRENLLAVTEFARNYR